MALPVFLFVLWAVAFEKAQAADINALMKQLLGNDRETQMRAADALSKYKEGMAIDALVNFVFLKKEHWTVKIKIIRILGDIPDQRIADRLVTVFNDPFLNEECPAMKWNAAIALGKDFNKGTRAVDSLIEALDYNNLLIKEAIIQSLGKIGDSKAVPFIIPSLRDQSFAIKFSAIKALENIGDPQVIHHLRQLAETEEDVYIKGAALAALKNFRPE